MLFEEENDQWWFFLNVPFLTCCFLGPSYIPFALSLTAIFNAKFCVKIFANRFCTKGRGELWYIFHIYEIYSGKSNATKNFKTHFFLSHFWQLFFSGWKIKKKLFLKFWELTIKEDREGGDYCPFTVYFSDSPL